MNMNIKAKMITGFSAVIAIMIGLSVFNYTAQQDAGKRAKWVSHTVDVLNNCDDLLLGLLNIETGYRGYMLTGVDDFLDPYKDGAQIYKKAFENLNSLTSDNPAQIARWQEINKEYEDLLKNWIEPNMMLRKEVNDAKKEIKTIQTQEAMAGGKQYMDQIRAVLNQAQNVEIDLMAKRSKESESAAKFGFLIILWGTIIGCIIGMIIAFFISQSISKRLINMVASAKKIAQKDLTELKAFAEALNQGDTSKKFTIETTKLQTGSSDEVGQLASAFNNIIDSLADTGKSVTSTCDTLSGLIAEAGMLRKAAIEGKLATRGNTSNFKGGYKDIVQGVNETLDAVINPLNVAAEYVNRISKGDIPPKITDNYNGDFNTIKNNLNQCIDAINGLRQDLLSTINAQKAGDITQRCSPEKLQGVYSTLAGGINETLEAVIAPVLEGVGLLEKYAVGNFTNEMRTLPGKQIILSNTINTVRSNVLRLIADADMLSAAAVEGKLATRADVTKHEGDFRKIVQGVNDTLDAVVNPINEAQSVLEKVAARDMTARVKGDYKGDLAKIKEAINTAVDNLDAALTQVSEATEQVSSGSQQISAGSQSLAQGANEQASSLEEVSSSLEEMSSMTKQNAENANQANNLAAEANGNAAQGGEAMKRMSTSINKIKVSSDQTAKIVKTIDEIAMQTNLLALNAAVEAARAGEAGRGFAVVAEEVRNLAQRSAEAAKNTANMIEESVKNAEEGVSISVEVSKSFDSIAGSVKKVNDLIAEIAAASQEQSQGIDQVNNAVAQMDKVTQQNAANSEESASASEEMSSQAEELQSMIGQFALSQSIQKRSVGSATHQVKVQGEGANNHSPLQQAATAHKNGNGKKHLKAAEFAMANKKVHADQLIPMDDEVLKQF